MRKFKDGDKVVFVEEQHPKDYTRNYIPLIGATGVIQHFSELYNEYLVLFENANATTFCYEGELEPLSPETVITCGGSRGYGKSITNRYMETEIKVDAIHTKIGELEKKMEEKEMKNEVLELWYKRENAKLKSEFKSEIEKYVNEHPAVVQYNTIINAYMDGMSALIEEYADFDIVSNISYSVTDDVDLHNIQSKLQDIYLYDNKVKHEEKLSELRDKYETIKAMLSLSSDLEYQLEVLTRYGVLNKKTKKMVD